MILLHLKSGSDILLNPKYIFFIHKREDYTYIQYVNEHASRDLEVKETPEEIQKILNKFYFPF